MTRIAAERPVLVLVLWTLFVWLSRVRNIVGDDGLSTAGLAGRLLVAVVFIGGAGYVAGTTWRRSPRRASVLAAFVVWTVGFWVVRGVGILFDDHSVGFEVVHTVLAVVSIGLALNAARSRRFVAVHAQR